MGGEVLQRLLGSYWDMKGVEDSPNIRLGWRGSFARRHWVIVLVQRKTITHRDPQIPRSCSRGDPTRFRFSLGI